MTGRIIGTGVCIPELVWDNNKLAEMVETNDEWIRERTGIARRHIEKEKSASEMAIEAAKKAMESCKEINVEDIGAIIVCSIAQEEVLPSVSCQVQAAIGATNAFCFDLKAACSGFVFAYNTCLAYMNMGLIRNALIIGVEKLSSITDWTDRRSCILFGDGAGAAVITACDEKGAMMMRCDGSRGNVLTCPAGSTLLMDGQEVFKFAVRSVPEAINEVLDQMKLAKEDVDYYILHQANRRIVESVAKRLGEPMSKFPTNLEEYGNTSSASIPLLIDELYRNGTLKKGSRLIMAGFGAGLSWGASYVTV
ncbi:MAG: ketoacyl-ACP synthase III [Lachnospiraceae bacterium]|nr:ketoacyl-ACP synthase III [Lachnospiraceae bacterium]